VLRETTSRGLCGLGCPSRTSERGGEGDCVKEGGGGERKCERVALRLNRNDSQNSRLVAPPPPQNTSSLGMHAMHKPKNKCFEPACYAVCVCVCVFITAGPIIKLCAGGEGDSEGHVL
jgi:hypothetical protein